MRPEFSSNIDQVLLQCAVTLRHEQRIEEKTLVQQWFSTVSGVTTSRDEPHQGLSVVILEELPLLVPDESVRGRGEGRRPQRSQPRRRLHHILWSGN